MKTINILKRLTTLYFITALFAVGCSPEDGEQGPAGPAGPQGEQGPSGQNGTDGQDGADGAQGEQGETGTANVIYSDWIARDFETAGAATTNEQLLTSFNPAEYNLNEDVLLVFGRQNINAIVSNVYQLPYILTSQQEFYSFRVSSFSGGSSLRIEVSALDGGTNLYTFFDDFRYVIIPGGQQTTGKQTPPDYSKMSYEEVAKLFNIKD
ncbi:collagen-like protein [Spongiivirga citrea]|uniref:Collagen-like protein n=1 Tax=Spongiivirga citrea TaxID=1481457 RepID=A0A6M0CNM3_9FLAO|nr:collagen-like protein [Spongiivirga citrea]NER17067.1 hypothetical protein [Spongiivirga citrea]